MSVVPRLRNCDELKINISLAPHLKNAYFTCERNIFIFLCRHIDSVSHYLDNTLKMVSTSYFRKEQYIFKKTLGFFSPKERYNCERAVFSFVSCFFLFCCCLFMLAHGITGMKWKLEHRSKYSCQQWTLRPGCLSAYAAQPYSGSPHWTEWIRAPVGGMPFP